jgi:hypothetical protein
MQERVHANLFMPAPIRHWNMRFIILPIDMLVPGHVFFGSRKILLVGSVIVNGVVTPVRIPVTYNQFILYWFRKTCQVLILDYLPINKTAFMEALPRYVKIKKRSH